MATRLALAIQQRFDNLTPSEQKLATLLLDRADEILTFSATELASLAGVSKATAGRFFRNLGYADFNDVRLQARDERNRTGPVQQVAMPVDPPRGSATLPFHLQVEMANLTRTFEELRSDTLAAVAEQLSSAKRVWVMGLGAEAGLATHARVVLARARPSIQPVSENVGTWAEELASASPGDALIVIALRPWPKIITPVLAFARTTRLSIFVLTDPTNAARARRYGATPLICHVSTPGPETSHTSVMSMLNLLSMTLTVRLGASARRRRELINDLREELDPQE
ncbi:MurR/RpiR family transcriptional regulator [Hoeflea sp.]|uniref:MurR/RpiR family transcriptional regulator n=1 Tax=Hoeflea sp. TaxID=1940281 RepID=UPI00198708ED|nr:MurR/RpiR family transcriptional regulator [Hoeflea sp.]MBC7284872.1 MurR/RpiR family transcriptional regulator [Hoeflea sp.]